MTYEEFTKAVKAAKYVFVGAVLVKGEMPVYFDAKKKDVLEMAKQSEQDALAQGHAPKFNARIVMESLYIN